ncbi:MAG: methylenetetrahydrofolate reductase [Dehalococcoidia bacterium]
MAKVTEKLAEKGKRPLFICDFSPPKGAGPSLLEAAKNLEADFICLAYNPGKSVRLDSAIAAYAIKERFQKEVVFNLACRDMNRLAVQAHLLGASALGLENVVVLKGDEFTGAEASQVGGVVGFTPTELIGAINSMNRGVDFRGRELQRPTSFCVGGAVNLGREIEGETRLAIKKAQAGADFLLTQPVYDARTATGFLDSFNSAWGGNKNIPVFFGVQVPVKGGVVFSDVPQRVRDDLDKGRDGAEIALETIHQLMDSGLDTFYLIPPIIKGGARDYDTAQQVLSAFR